MRPNQNNKNRQRGRNNNGGRKHVNPLSRNFESNGPDVKVRGNAAHVAEKYLQLARDAQSSGDPILAENYLQHAEHYFRIVASAQQQQNQPRDQFGQVQGGEPDEDDDFPPINDRFASPEPMQRFQPQPQPQQDQPGFNGTADGEEGGDGPGQPTQPAEAGGADAGNGDFGGQQQGDGEGRRHRDRNRRRRGRGNGENGQNGDPANSPQPEVGELPAFLTATGSTTVAE